MAVCEAEVEKLTDELIDAKDRSVMHLRRYYEVASELGFNPERDHVSHADVLQRAKELARFARVA